MYPERYGRRLNCLIEPLEQDRLSYGLIQSLWSKKLITPGQNLARKLPEEHRDYSVYSSIKAFVSTVNGSA